MTTHKPGRRGRPPRKRDPPQQPSQSSVSIGNCRVEFPASFGHSLDAEGLQVNVSDTCYVGIKVAKDTTVPLTAYSFTLLNPKSLDGVGKELLQDVLKLYSRELPAMNYAANTGKESPFLEKCLFGGKYCTLILRNAELELLGAMTYQMLPTDTNQAELPLAAVAQAHHRKGFGTCLFKQLQRRLLDVGVLSIFCWGDQESEAFWAKQGFVIVAEVDGRGKPCKLPIKADVRRAMSIPGSATLMISYLSSPSIIPAFPGLPASAVVSNDMTTGEIPEKTSSETCKAVAESSPPRLNSRPQDGEKATPKLSPQAIATPQVLGENKSSHVSTVTPGLGVGEPLNREACEGKKNFSASITPFYMEGMLSMAASEDSTKENSSAPLESPPLAVERLRPPLADTTNTDHAPDTAPDSANRPLKKRPITRVGLARVCNANKSNVSASGTTTTLDGVEDNVAGKEAKADDAGSPTKLKTSTSVPKERTAVKRRGRPPSGVHKEARVDDSFDKENEALNSSTRGMDCESIPSVFPEVKTGAKRGRDSEAHTDVFGRRASRRRTEDPVPRMQLAEKTDDQAAKETRERTNDQVEDGVQLMLDLQLPHNVTLSGRCISADAEKSATQDSRHPDGGAINGTTHAKSFDCPAAHTDVEQQQPSAIEGEPAARSADAPGHRHGNDVKSAGQPSNKTSPVIIFLNMKDEKVKKQLTKDVEKLSGTVTRDGCECTHVVTGEVRRTLNFCVAISSGAWILSSDWIKKSAKQKSFADEGRFVLRDRKFEAKYKVSLHDVIRRAKQSPNLLLDGMLIYPTPQIHPPVDTISQIIKAGGGKVLSSLEEALQLDDKSHAAIIAAEEDVSDAKAGAKAGLRTFSSDWLLTSIVKQELDLTATQFSESL